MSGSWIPVARISSTKGCHSGPFLKVGGQTQRASIFGSIALARSVNGSSFGV